MSGIRLAHKATKEIDIKMSSGKMIQVGLAIVALYISLQGNSLLAAEYKGTVTRVIDGDSIEVSHESRAVIIRLRGIDAPEISQPYGRIAMVVVFRHAFGKVVRIETHGLDSHGRTIGDVYLPDDTLLNKEMVRLGLAWWYCKDSHDEVLRQLELVARDEKLGLWKDPTASPPWVFRKRNGIELEHFDGLCFPTVRLSEKRRRGKIAKTQEDWTGYFSKCF